MIRMQLSEVKRQMRAPTEKRLASRGKSYTGACSPVAQLDCNGTNLELTTLVKTLKNDPAVRSENGQIFGRVRPEVSIQGYFETINSDFKLISLILGPEQLQALLSSTRSGLRCIRPPA